MDLTQLGEILLNNMPDALVVCDKDGIIRHWNAGAEHIFGFSLEEACESSLDLIIPERQRPAHWAGYANSMKTGQTKYGAGEMLSVPALHKDGRRLSIQFSIFFIPDANGDVIGIGAVMRDVTKDFEERKRLRDLLAKSGAAILK